MRARWRASAAWGSRSEGGTSRGAFAPRARVPAAIALVDDVYTSGSTAAAAASALRGAGARRVEVVTFARAVRYAQR